MRLRSLKASKKVSHRLSVENLENRDVPSGPYGLDIPTGHPRLWFNADRLAQAKTWYATHTFTPAVDSPLQNAFVYQLTGNTTYAQRAIGSLMNFTLSDSDLAGVASDNYRWADWVPVVYDWCFDQMSATQRSDFTARYDYYTTTQMQKEWGGPGMTPNNYYWGVWRNELNWGIATYGISTSANTFLADALVTRWQNDFIPWAAGPGAGGVPQEGTGYGRYMLEYPTIPLQTAIQEGRNLLAESNFFTEAAYNLIYSTSPGPVTSLGNVGGSYYQLFPFNDDQFSYGFPDAADTYYADFMTNLAGNYDGTPLGGYIRKWLEVTGAKPTNYVAAVDKGGPSLPFDTLPKDYYAPGTSFLYARSGWSPGSMSMNFQLGSPTGVGHWHEDAGSFQLMRGGQWLTKESTGYSDSVTGFGGSGTEPIESTLPHNTLMIGGLGQARYYRYSDPFVTRLESQPDYTFASVDLTPSYQADDTRFNNPYAQRVVRDFVYVRGLDTLIALDRVQSSTPSAGKTFLLHFPTSPTVSGNTVLGVVGNQALKLTALTPSGQSSPAMRIVDERPATTYSNTDYQWRLEETTSGQAQSYLINVMQARDVTGADLQISMTEDSTSFTITLKDPVTGKTAVVKLAKGMTSTGGAFGFSAAGTPTTLSPLATTVEQIQATANGVVWGGTTPTPPVGAASLQVTAATSVTAGSPTTVTVRALDLSGSVVAGYTGTVRFSSSDVQAGLPASYTFTAADAGAHTFTVTLKTAGTQSVQVTDAANLAGSTNVSVTPAAASNISITGFPSPTTAGTPQSFTVSLRDSFGNMATGYTGTLRFSSSDLQAALPTNYTFTAADRGRKSFQGALKTAGTQSLTAADMILTQLNGTQGGIVVNPPGDTTPPNVTAMTPTGGTTGVGLGTNVTATFSEGVQAATISFTLKDAGNNVVPAVIGYDSTTKTVTLTPSAGLATNTTYTATLSGAKDLAGNVMSGSVVWSFTTTGTSTVAPPIVTGYTPANGSTDVDPWTALTATFSTQVQGRTVSFVLKDASGTSVLATMWYDGSTQTAKLVPSAALASNTTYTATVSGALDLSGNVMTDPVTWTFTTSAYTDWKQATAADFASGTFNGTMPTSPAAGIQLQSNFTENFTGTSLNTSNWTRTNWGSGAAATVSNGVVSVAASAITSTQSVGANGVSGYVRFRAASYQHFGLATSVASESGSYWAMFSTYGTTNTLYARVNINGATKNVSLGALPTGFHVYTITPTTGGYQFFIDGKLKTTVSATMPTGVAMKAVLSSYSKTTISANWIQFVSFAPSGSFVSMVYDATRTANWGTATWAGDLPAGTTVTVQTRSGNSATPDSTWSDWATVSNGGKVASPAGRYLQYQVLFTTTNPLLTPTLTMMDLTWI